MPAKNLEAVDILEALESKIAYIPGGRDREGRPLIVVNVPSELQPTTKPRLEALMAYFLSIFSDETKRNGLVLIVDARKGAWRVARSCIRLSTVLLGSSAESVIVVRPDGFWDKKVDSCTKSHKDGEPTYLTLARLQFHVDFDQLPHDLGGSKPYDHVDWIQKRVKLEDYNRDAFDLISRMTDLHQKLVNLSGFRILESNDNLGCYLDLSRQLTMVARHVIQTGKNLIGSISRESTRDISDSTKQIHQLIDAVESKQLDIENSWTEAAQNLDTARVIGDLEKGVSRVTDWILGPADAMLNSCCQVGFDVPSSEELRRRHEKLELECTETYGRYAELLHKIDSLPSTRLSEDLKSQRDFMDFVCRSFANRLQRRRNVLITSQRFFRLVSEYFDRTSEVFDKLVMGNRTDDFSQAGANLWKLQQSQASLETLERELRKEGEKLSDILSMPVKDALGRDVHVDYGEDIVNVRDILDATNARKNIFNDSVELQKLTLRQYGLIYTYETDAEQPIKWLIDLYDVLLKNHMEIGCNAAEIQLQKEEHESFKKTAKGTYDYGCQLINGARVLRLYCRIPIGSNATLLAKLRQSWRKLRSVCQEQLTRLRVCAIFHKKVEDHCRELRSLNQTIVAFHHCVKPLDVIKDSGAKVALMEILRERETLLVEVGRTVRVGRLLRTRLKEPLQLQQMSETEDASGKGSNLTAVESISAKLAEVKQLAEQVDAKLSVFGVQTQPDPATPSSTTSASTSSSSKSVTTTSKTVSGKTEPIPHGTPASTAIIASTTIPLISSSVSTVQLQPKCADAIVRESFTAGLVISTPVAANGTMCVDVVGLKADAAASNVSKEEEKISGKLVHETEAEDIFDKSFDDSLADDSNIEGYVTATDCSITPTARSRSESFVTSPECEDLAAPATVTAGCDTWRAIEEPKYTATDTALSSTINKQLETSNEPGIEESAVSTEISKPSVDKTNEETQIEKIVSMDKTIEEKSGSIMKEVTETTTLRVSHDTRFGIASYKVISNTVEDHRENIDVTEIKDLERIVTPDVCEMTNGLHQSEDAYPTTESYSRRDELSTKTEDIERVIKFTKFYEINKDTNAIPSDVPKDLSLSLKEYTRHHEDSGIEMSPTKKDENPEGQDFLEKAEKVSSIEASTINGNRSNEQCCNCNCGHEPPDFAPFSVQQNFIINFNDDRRHLPLSNAS